MEKKKGNQNTIIIVREGITISIKKLADKDMDSIQEIIYNKLREIQIN